MSDNVVHLQLWVVEYRLGQRLCRWIRAFAPDAPVRAQLLEELEELHGDRASLVELRRATDAEHHEHLGGDATARPFLGA